MIGLKRFLRRIFHFRKLYYVDVFTHEGVTVPTYGVAFFFKQWGGVHKWKNGRRLNGREYNEFPKDARALIVGMPEFSNLK